MSKTIEVRAVVGDNVWTVSLDFERQWKPERQVVIGHMTTIVSEWYILSSEYPGKEIHAAPEMIFDTKSEAQVAADKLNRQGPAGDTLCAPEDARPTGT